MAVSPGVSERKCKLKFAMVLEITYQDNLDNLDKLGKRVEKNKIERIFSYFKIRMDIQRRVVLQRSFKVALFPNFSAFPPMG